MAERGLRDAVRGALAAATIASIGYQIVTMVAAARWRSRSRGRKRRAVAADGPAPHLPSVSVLKPVRGVDPHGEHCFASFCVQEYSEYEILFGVAEPEDPAVEVVRRLQERYPAVTVRLVQTTGTLGANRKVCNLHGLAGAARHELLVVSDSDMTVAPNYLRQIAASFNDPRVGLVTCPYRGVEPEGLPAILEALGIAAGFMPGVFVAAVARPAFAFGSTIALRRETLARIGGFEGFVDYLADDYQMGKRVADLGLHVHLSPVVVDTVLGRRSFAESWSRRLRWARTVRACRPLGHLGSGLTHTTALALLTALAWSGPERASKRTEGQETNANRGDKGALGGLVVGLALAVRLLAAWRVAVVALASEAVGQWFPLVLVSDLVEAVLWGCSLFGRDVLWRGQRYRLHEGGRIERLTPEADDSVSCTTEGADGIRNGSSASHES
jgi:ceramide glucosyltransferase